MIRPVELELDLDENEDEGPQIQKKSADLGYQPMLFIEQYMDDAIVNESGRKNPRASMRMSIKKEPCEFEECHRPAIRRCTFSLFWLNGC